MYKVEAKGIKYTEYCNRQFRKQVELDWRQLELTRKGLFRNTLGEITVIDNLPDSYIEAYLRDNKCITVQGDKVKTNLKRVMEYRQLSWWKKIFSRGVKYV